MGKLKGGILLELLMGVTFILALCLVSIYQPQVEQVEAKAVIVETDNKIMMTLPDGSVVEYEVVGEEHLVECPPHPHHNNHWEGEKCLKN